MSAPGAHGAPPATSREWQLAADAAARYEEVLVPTILGPAARVLVEEVAPLAGERVLDVGCGTGAATRFAAERAGGVVGVDVNPAMLACAREHLVKVPRPVELREASALDLPFESESFDVVLCAQTLQFLADRGAAVAEMRRVVKPDGRIGVSTWSPLDRSPYFEALVEAVAEHMGSETAAGLSSAFTLSDPDALADTLRAVTDRVDVREVRFDVELPAAADFVPRHIVATPMAAGYAQASTAARRAVVDDVAARMSPYTSNGGMTVPFRTYVAVAS